MLKYRVIFGTLMVVFFISLVLVDAKLDGSLNSSAVKKDIQASGLCILIVLLAIPAQMELGKLLEQVGVKPFYAITTPATMLLATWPYWHQLEVVQSSGPGGIYVLLVLAGTLLAAMFCQARMFGTKMVVVNCSGNFFAAVYLGLLSSFCLAVRIDFGPWAFLMFIFTVKFADTGAYTAGRLFGKRKFSPRISPGKTWEGVAGAVAIGAIVAVAFSACFGIMGWQSAVLFGAVLAFAGQLADLAESMIKRDAGQKDSSSLVPGFGGLLDVLDSPLGTAPLAYAFFMIVC